MVWIRLAIQRKFHIQSYDISIIKFQLKSIIVLLTPHYELLVELNDEIVGKFAVIALNKALNIWCIQKLGTKKILIS